MDDAYVRSPQEVLKHFGVSEQAGLSSSAVEASRREHGRNGEFKALHGLRLIAEVSLLTRL